MKTLHIANTNLEWELIQKSSIPLTQAFEKNAVFMQLQFLPFLYAASEDGVAVTAAPSKEFWEGLEKLDIAPPKLHLLSELDFSGYEKVESWGASLGVSAWAKNRGLSYLMPDWQVVEQVNSKFFSFSASPKLPGARLLYNEEEVWTWLKNTEGSVVFKTCFGVSGKGHFIWEPHAQPDAQKLLHFLGREWHAKRPVLGEPWAFRVLDFSTQWKIDREIEYLGATICETTDKGVHKQNSVGDETLLFGDKLHYLHAHTEVVRPILAHMASLGYFGHVGIDAMLYTQDGKIHLHPVVEINARKTMGWVALEMQRRHFANKTLTLRYLPHTPSMHNLLPSSLISTRSKPVHFPRALNMLLKDETHCVKGKLNTESTEIHREKN